MTDEALQPARDRLADAVAALIDPQPVALDAGRRTFLDSIYQQLIEACYQKHSLGGGRSQPASPLFIDATDCRYEIDTLVRVEHPETREIPNHREWVTVWRLQQIDARTWRPQDVPHINTFSGDLERLTHKARNLLTPPTNWFLPNPCPLCGKTTVYMDNSGDQVRRPALQLTVDYCRCGNTDCDGWWPSSQFQFLGALLGYRPPEGVIGA